MLVNSLTVFLFSLHVIHFETHSKTFHTKTTWTMPAKPLTPEQKEEAAKLKKVFEKKKDNLGLTQASLADRLGFSTQSSVNQYMNGRIPLNVEVAVKFAQALECSIMDFSPSMQIEIDKLAEFSTRNRNRQTRESSGEYSTSTKESTMLRRYGNAGAATQASIDLLLLPPGERSELNTAITGVITALESLAIESLRSIKNKAA
jgi:transcriptional regulator with XRE-family HTH domain